MISKASIMQRAEDGVDKKRKGRSDESIKRREPARATDFHIAFVEEPASIAAMGAVSDLDRLDLLVTNYNTSALTNRCLEAIRRFDHPRLHRCVVVDDASTEALELPEWEKIKLLRNPDNLGLVRSLNRGMAECTSPAVVIFDSDAYPLGPFVEEALAHLRGAPDLGLAAFHTRGTGDIRTACSEPEHGLLSLLLGQALYAKWRRLFPARSRPLLAFTCALLVRREAFRQAGGFDERFDWLELDNDLSMAVRLAGWQVRQTEDLLAFHEGGGTPQASSRRLLRFYRNRWLLLNKHARAGFPALSVQLILLRLRLELLGLRLLGRKRFGDQAVWQDKMEGRRAIITFMKEEALALAREVSQKDGRPSATQ